jgi:uncharacterized protein (TIGR02118 family)
MRPWSKASSVLLVLITLGITGSCAPPAAGPPNPSATAATAVEVPGFKFMVLIKKQEGISFEEYRRYFMETHLPYVRAIPGLRGYKINFRQPDDEEAPYDGISEFWFDDRAAFDRAMASAETQATLADAAKFLMPPQILLVDERVVLPPHR